MERGTLRSVIGFAVVGAVANDHAHRDVLAEADEKGSVRQSEEGI